MIDWVSAVVPCWHPAPISGGTVSRTDSEGVVEWQVARWLPVRGSFESGVQVRTATGPGCGDCTHLAISGNIAKFFQGHNLFGTDDVPGLVFEFMRAIALRELQGDLRA